MHVLCVKMNASSWRKAADLIAQGTQANQQVQVAATADCLIYESEIFTLMTIPLVEEYRVLDVYKIHSLPLLHPILKK